MHTVTLDGFADSVGKTLCSSVGGHLMMGICLSIWLGSQCRPLGGTGCDVLEPKTARHPHELGTRGEYPARPVQRCSERGKAGRLSAKGVPTKGASRQEEKQ